jgi:hypothetical protein
MMLPKAFRIDIPAAESHPPVDLQHTPHSQVELNSIDDIRENVRGQVPNWECSLGVSSILLDLILITSSDLIVAVSGGGIWTRSYH